MIKSITIETHVFVMTETEPLILQGFFSIKPAAVEDEKIYLFKVQVDAITYVQGEFNLEHYHLCELHLVRDRDTVELKIKESRYEDVCYVLLFALHQTLNEKKKNQSWQKTSIELETVLSFTQYIKTNLNSPQKLIQHPELGFSVSIPFTPKDKSGLKVIKQLLDSSRGC